MRRHDQIPAVIASPFGAAYLYRRSPWVPLWWSIILPGFGHLHLGQNLIGFILMGWEILINDQAHINLAIYHTFLGEIDKAKAVVDYRWAMLYPLFYIFAMFDSYRLAVDMNNQCALEQLQSKRRFDRISLSVAGMQILDWRNPTIAAFWSAVMPGLGHLYCNRLVKFFAVTLWYLAVVLKSGLSLATYHTLHGNFALAAAQLNYQWAIFWPSIYIFSIADAYGDVLEQNRNAASAFRLRMAKYLKNENVNRGGRSLF